MKTVAFVPIRLNSQRVAGKNLRPLDGSPLMCHILKTLTEVEGIDEVYVFCSDEGIRALLPEAFSDFPHIFRPVFCKKEVKVHSRSSCPG